MDSMFANVALRLETLQSKTVRMYNYTALVLRPMYIGPLPRHEKVFYQKLPLHDSSKFSANEDSSSEDEDLINAT